MAPRFSVLLPTHNRADVLGYAIESVLRQTEQDFELLVVGDGCTDSTADVVNAYADPRIRWFDLPKAPNFGYANRNIALKRARGDLIAFMAHDDIVFDDHLALLAATIEETGAEWAYSRPLWVGIDGEVIVYSMNLENSSELDVFLTRRNTIPATCVLHRRLCFDKYGYWPEDAPKLGDWELWKRIIEGGGRSNFAHCSEPTCLHFVADWRRESWTPSSLAPEDRLIVTSLSIPAGRTEQQVFAEAITSQDSNFVCNLRQQARRTVDRLAWRAVVSLVPHNEKMVAASRAAEKAAEKEQKRALRQAERLTRLEKKAALLEHELAAVHRSASWRITAPLRAIKRVLFRGKTG
jgi:hypothetical protein